MLYTRLVIGEETLSSTSVFNFCHCAIFSTAINSVILGSCCWALSWPIWTAPQAVTRGRRWTGTAFLRRNPSVRFVDLGRERYWRRIAGGSHRPVRISSLG